MPLLLLNVTDPLVNVVLLTAMPEMPVCAPPTLAPEIVIALPAWLIVMLLPPAIVNVPELTCASTPAVLPASVTLWTFCV